MRPDIKVFAENLDEATLAQISALENNPAFEDAKVRVMPDCLTEDAEVLTSKGFKRIVDVTQEDLIATYLDNTGHIIFSPYIAKIERSVGVGEKILRITNNRKSFTMQVSKKHRMAVRDNMGALAEDCRDLFTKHLVFNGIGVLENTCDSYTDNELKILCWILGDGNIKCHRTNTGESYRIRFEFVKKRKAQRLMHLLNLACITYSQFDRIRKGKNSRIAIEIIVKDSKKWVDILGKDKKIPFDFLQLNKTQSNIVLEEIIQIDGDYESFCRFGTYRFNSTNKEYVDVVSGIISLNKGFSYVRHKKEHRDGKRKDLWYVNMISECNMIKNKNGLHNSKLVIEEIEYGGKLVCLEVPTSYFVARQFGGTFITGNCHAGAGCCIGLTSSIGDKVIPDLVGVDIGCGVSCLEIQPHSFNKHPLDLDKLDKEIRRVVPSGFAIQDKDFGLTKDAQRGLDKIGFKYLRCMGELRNTDRFPLGLGTLGGGNHFIEVAKSSEGHLYFVVHSGSRNLGKQVADFYQSIAKAKNGYLEGEDMLNYLHDMEVCQNYANMNRMFINLRVFKAMNWASGNCVSSTHNYVEFNGFGDDVLRKGAISARENEECIIPINMRDGSLLCRGKGNSDWNYSAPHGAGRIYGRNQAKKTFSVEEYEKEMVGVHTSCVSEETLDECPMAYKDIEYIKRMIEPTVEIIDVLKPIYNFKAGGIAHSS